jgi:hypothetical protein
VTPREIIAAAWAITTREPQLRRWAFTSSLLETLLKVKLVGYQLYFAYEYFFGTGEAGFFDVEIKLYHSLPFGLFLTIVTVFILMVVVEFFFPHLCMGALIGLSAKSYRKEEVKGGLVLGLYNFFSIFTIHEFLTLGSLSTIITICSLVIRYVDGPIGSFAITIILILFLFSLLLKFFFSFAEEAVVIQKMGIFQAIGRSFKLIVSHLGHVVFLLILLFVISLRIVVNAVAVVLIPAVILGLGLLLATVLPAVVSYTLSGLVGVGLVIAASYLFAYIQAFKVAVWTITYLELIKHKDLDVIVD